MSFLIEFWNFLKVRKKFWLLPIILVLALFGGLIILSQGSAVAPFYLHNFLIEHFKKIILNFSVILISFLLIEIFTRVIIFFPTNSKIFKFGFDKNIIIEIVDLSKLQINITDRQSYRSRKK